MKKFLESNLFLYLILLVASLFILLQSPLAPFAQNAIDSDSSIFIYSAQQILDGQLMYKEIVDHKGPCLYLIDAVALLMFGGNRTGIWIFEVLSLFVASIFMYKTARLFAGKVPALLAVVCAVLLLAPCLQEGNLTEEWALPFISIALHIFVDYLKNKQPLSIPRLFILSLTFVLTFMLRANMVVLWAGFGIILLIRWILEKRYRELIRNVSFILCFIFLSVLPFFLYFYLNGTLSDAIYLVFQFNLSEYSPQSAGWDSLLKTGFNIGKTGVFIPILIAVYMFWRNKKNLLYGSLLVVFILTALTCSLGRSYPHYYMIFIPLCVIPYTYIIRILKEGLPQRYYVILSIVLVAFHSLFMLYQLGKVYYNYAGKDDKIKNIEKITEVITQNTKATDPILVTHFQYTSLYLYAGRKCAIRFSYPLIWSSLARENYVKDTEKALPKIIIREDPPIGDDFDLNTLLFDQYQLIETDVENMEVWKLKTSINRQ